MSDDNVAVGQPVRCCAVCGASLDGRHRETLTCSASCRRELARYKAVLAGRADGPYSTLQKLAERRRQGRAKRSEAGAPAPPSDRHQDEPRIDPGEYRIELL
jgi:hypothetical protein